MFNTAKLFFWLTVAALLISCPSPAAAQKKKAAKPKKTALCLPSDVKPDEIVAYDGNGAKLRTVLDELKLIKARCVKGKLLAANKREIRFFRPPCWGNPPADYQEILAETNRNLEALKKRYHVVIFQCNPMIQ